MEDLEETHCRDTGDDPDNISSHRGCCNRLALEAENERLNAQVAELRAALVAHSTNLIRAENSQPALDAERQADEAAFLELRAALPPLDVLRLLQKILPRAKDHCFERVTKDRDNLRRKWLDKCLECDELRAALASINEAASRILSEPGRAAASNVALLCNDTGVLITICTIADKALAEKPAPESDKENHEDRH